MTLDQQLQRFAASLGWFNLERFEHTVDEQRIVWFSEGEIDELTLQINLNPLRVMVRSFEHDIFTGWFRLAEPIDVEAEVARLGPVLLAENFNSAEGREKFRELFPECANKGREASSLWFREDENDPTSPTP